MLPMSPCSVVPALVKLEHDRKISLILKTKRPTAGTRVMDIYTLYFCNMWLWDGGRGEGLWGTARGDSISLIPTSCANQTVSIPTHDHHLYAKPVSCLVLTQVSHNLPLSVPYREPRQQPINCYVLSLQHFHFCTLTLPSSPIARAPHSHSSRHQYQPVLLLFEHSGAIPPPSVAIF